MNRVRRQNEVLSQVRNLAYSLLSTETIDGSVIANPGSERVQAFVTDVDPSRLAGIELVRIGAPSPDLLSSTTASKTTRRNRPPSMAPTS